MDNGMTQEDVLRDIEFIREKLPQAIRTGHEDYVKSRPETDKFILTACNHAANANSYVIDSIKNALVGLDGFEFYEKQGHRKLVILQKFELHVHKLNDNFTANVNNTNAGQKTINRDKQLAFSGEGFPPQEEIIPDYPSFIVGYRVITKDNLVLEGIYITQQTGDRVDWCTPLEVIKQTCSDGANIYNDSNEPGLNPTGKELEKQKHYKQRI